MSIVTLVSLGAAVGMFVWSFVLQNAETSEERGELFYTQRQMTSLKESAASAREKEIKNEIRTSLENGKSTLRTFRDLYEGEKFVVARGESFSFYNINTQMEMNPFGMYDFKLRESGHLTYVGDEENVKTRIGMDVSESNGDIDWEAVSSSGITFAMVRLGSRDENGELREDSRFAANLEGAYDAGLSVGVTYDLTAISPEEAVEDAGFVVTLLSGSASGNASGNFKKMLTLPVALHIAEPKAGDRNLVLSKADRSEILRTFCETVEKAGYNVEIFGYTELFFLLSDITAFSGYDFWICDNSGQLYFPYKFSCWQYSDSGIVNGVNGKVNMDIRVSY